MRPHLLRIIIANEASPLLGTLHALNNPLNIFITGSFESWKKKKKLRFRLRIPPREIAYGICVWIQVSLMPQITGFHNLHPSQMKNGFFVLPCIIILHLNDGESGTYACLGWVACYSSINKTLRALYAFGNSVLSPKSLGTLWKEPKLHFVTFPTIVPSSPPRPWLNKICDFTTSVSSYLNSKHCGPCFKRSIPNPLLPSLPSLPPSLFIAEASLLAWIVLWHCWPFFPYRTFLWFLGFLLPCWLPLLGFPNRLFSIFP